MSDEITFGPFRLDRARERLWRDDREVEIQPRPFAVLRHLAERPGALVTRAELLAESAKLSLKLGTNPKRPEFWGGYRITPIEIEFWADGAFRLHDRFRWTREDPDSPWSVARLNP